MLWKRRTERRSGAALALRDRLPLRELSVERLGDELKRRGIPRHLEELGLTEPWRKER